VRSRRWCTFLALLATAPLAVVSCYGGLPLPAVETAASPVNATCVDTIARVFADAGFVPVSLSTTATPPLLYAPRTTAPLSFTMTLGWAVGVSFPPGELPSGCGFRLQALSIEPDCVPRACISPARSPSPQAVSAEESASFGFVGGLAPSDPSCYGIMPTCPLSPVGGPHYAAALAELARRLRDALARTPPPPGIK
jgi:hypothetical protein